MEQQTKSYSRKTVTSPENVKKLAWLFFLLMLIISITKDLSVFLLSIPTFNDLEEHEGIVEITHGGYRNSYLSLKADDKVILFTCWISSGGISDCIEKEKRAFYIGKPAKIYSYRALINGIFYENRLLQLEVDGKTIISYEQQKTKYLQKKDSYFYLQTLFCFVALLFLTTLYFKDTKEMQ